MTSFQLSGAGLAALQDILGHLSSRAGRPITVDGLIRLWIELVSEVENGYPDSIYDYTNDLAVRGLLQELLDRGPEELRRGLHEMIQPWDERFRAVTRSPKKPLQPGKAVWWLRIPSVLKGELKEDLLAGGYLEDS